MLSYETDEEERWGRYRIRLGGTEAIEQFTVDRGQ